MNLQVTHRFHVPNTGTFIIRIGFFWGVIIVQLYRNHKGILLVLIPTPIVHIICLGQKRASYIVALAPKVLLYRYTDPEGKPLQEVCG